MWFVTLLAIYFGGFIHSLAAGAVTIAFQERTNLLDPVFNEVGHITINEILLHSFLWPVRLVIALYNAMRL